MANNRMYLRCTFCEGGDCRFLLAKYYPSDGWTNFIVIVREMQSKEQLLAVSLDDLTPRLSEVWKQYESFNDWLDRHRHHPETTYMIEFESGVTVTSETGRIR